ncbi:MAG: bifunctional 5,10-methylenetetrahydrofolate dehydrogenase/5,10-methenyltetrahydrofolate cyclohydrolase [Clostridia bacterium]
MGEIINVREIVSKRKEALKVEIINLKKQNIFPKLVVILANKEESSRSYINSKRKLCEELGVIEEEYILDETTSTNEMLELINKLNNDKTVDGILVQLPIYKHLNEEKILESIDSKKDVDGFHPLNLGNLLIGKKGIVSCTPKGIMTILDSIGTEFLGKEAVVVGRSKIVGKPIAQLLLARGATVTMCHSKTLDLKSHTKRADILVIATGVPNLISSDMIKKGSIIIDVGINRVDGKIVGDVDTNGALNYCKYISPVPGGVGLTTVLSLIENLIEIAKNRKN